jgi:hypothetical protein
MLIVFASNARWAANNCSSAGVHFSAVGFSSIVFFSWWFLGVIKKLPLFFVLPFFTDGAAVEPHGACRVMHHRIFFLKISRHEFFFAFLTVSPVGRVHNLLHDRR